MKIAFFSLFKIAYLIHGQVYCKLSPEPSCKSFYSVTAQKIKFPADLGKFIEEILIGKLHFLCSVCFFVVLFQSQKSFIVFDKVIFGYSHIISWISCFYRRYWHWWSRQKTNRFLRIFFVHKCLKLMLNFKVSKQTRSEARRNKVIIKRVSNISIN